MANLNYEVDSFRVTRKKRPVVMSPEIRNQDRCTTNLPGESIQGDQEKRPVLMFQMMKRNQDLSYYAPGAASPLFVHRL